MPTPLALLSSEARTVSGQVPFLAYQGGSAWAAATMDITSKHANSKLDRSCFVAKYSAE